MKPFVKWAGGKSGLLNTYRYLYPPDLQEGKITRYVEPFVGGGAVLFDVLSYPNIKEVYISDKCIPLMLTYNAIKEDVWRVIESLEQLAFVFLSSEDTKFRKDFYCKAREIFNEMERTEENKFSIAPFFLFLNKTCYNGLYRENSKGEFNAPMGRYKNPKICDRDLLISASEALQKVTILIGDYRECRDFVDSNTFVYLDPPYHPISSTSNFTKYTEDGFTESDQRDLYEFFSELDSIGAKLMLSNSYSEEDDLIRNLYKRYKLHKVEARRSINSKGDKRGKIYEYVITNY